MATPEAQDAVAKERIVKHMNADHADSVSLQAQNVGACLD